MRKHYEFYLSKEEELDLSGNVISTGYDLRFFPNEIGKRVNDLVVSYKTKEELLSLHLTNFEVFLNELSILWEQEKINSIRELGYYVMEGERIYAKNYIAK